MTPYTAVAHDGTPFDIGEHASQSDAENYAYQIFGDSIQLVTPQVTTTVDVTAPMPTTSKATLVLAGLLLLMVFKGRI